MKKAHLRRDKKVLECGDSAPSVVKDCFWISGSIAVVASVLINVWAMEFATVVLLASTSIFTIVFNSILSPILLGEKWYPTSELTMIVLLFGGCTICLFQTPRNEEDFSIVPIQEVIDLHQTYFTNVFSLLFLSAVFTLQVYILLTEKKII